MIDKIISDVIDRLKEIAGVRYVSYDWGQLSNLATPAVRWPCLVVRCERVDYSYGSYPLQQCEAELIITLQWLRSMNVSGERATEDSLRCLGLLNSVEYYLSCWHPRESGYLRRERASRVGSDVDKGLETWEVRYRVQWQEDGPAPLTAGEEEGTELEGQRLR